MIVPSTNATDPRFVDAPQTQGPDPSTEALLLMALAQMKNQGRFDKLPASTNIEDMRARNPRQAQVRNNMIANIRDQAEDANDRSDLFQSLTPSGIVAGLARDVARKQSREPQR